MTLPKSKFIPSCQQRPPPPLAYASTIRAVSLCKPRRWCCQAPVCEVAPAIKQQWREWLIQQWRWQYSSASIWRQPAGLEPFQTALCFSSEEKSIHNWWQFKEGLYCGISNKTSENTGNGSKETKRKNTRVKRAFERGERHKERSAFYFIFLLHLNCNETQIVSQAARGCQQYLWCNYTIWSYPPLKTSMEIRKKVHSRDQRQGGNAKYFKDYFSWAERSKSVSYQSFPVCSLQPGLWRARFDFIIHLLHQKDNEHCLIVVQTHLTGITSSSHVWACPSSHL